jgi:hypothetical protein
VALPRSLDQSAYRIIQEALTNALRHAGGTIAHVAVRYRNDRLELEVANDGRDNGRPRNHPGEAEGSSAYVNGSRCSAASSRPARRPKAGSWSDAGSP